MARTTHDNDERALAASGETTTDPSVAELERHVADLAASPHFVPLMGSFRDLLEAERRRNRLRALILGGGTILVLALFIWGPLRMMQTVIQQSERRLAGERQSLERVERALNESMSVLAEASRDLRTTLEAYRQASVPAPATAVPTTVPAEVPASAVPASLPVPVVSATAAPVAATTGEVAAVTGYVPPAPGTHAPAPGEAVPTDLFRALSSTPAVPPLSPDKTNRVTAPPPAAATETRLSDTLADVERAIQSIRMRRAALTNATGTAKP